MVRKFGIEMEITWINQQTAIKALRAVNINVQAEGYNHTTRPHWKIVSDASVNGGFEVVSPILVGEAGIAEAEVVARALDDAGASVNSTCGLHVHFDASDLSVNHIKTILRRYHKHEHEIDAFMPKSRRGNENQYCLSLAPVISERLENAATMDELIRCERSRYFKINLQSLGRHGTLEFRQHSGTVNAAKIVNWVRFLAEFIDECKRIADNVSAPVADDTQNIPALSGVQGRLAEMFRTQGVVTLTAISEAFGWLDITSRAAITRLRKAGMNISATKVDGKAAYKLNGSYAVCGSDSLWNGISEAVALFYQRRAAVLAVAA